MSQEVIIIIGYICFAAGILGLVFPLLPGAPVVFLGAFLVAWASEYQTLSVTGLVIIGVLAVLAFLVDFVASAIGAKRVGASKMALLWATIGGVLGIVFGLLGMVLGPFIGGFLGELYSTKDLVKAGKVGIGTWIGIALGAVAKICLGIIMILVLVFG